MGLSTLVGLTGLGMTVRSLWFGDCLSGFLSSDDCFNVFVCECVCACVHEIMEIQIF